MNYVKGSGFENYNHAKLVFPKKDYVLKMESKGMFCEIFVNGAPIINNIGALRGISQVNFGINEWIKNGINEISMEVSSWNWIDKNTRNSMTQKEKEEYREIDDYCKLELEIASFEGKNLERKEDKVTALIVKLDKDKKITVQDSFAFNNDTSLSKTIKSKFVTRDYGFQEDITSLYSVSREFKATSVPDWLWSNSQPFEMIENGKEKLEEAYYEVWKVFNNKDKDELKKLLSIFSYEVGMGKTLLEVDEEIKDMFYKELRYEDLLDYELDYMLPLDTHNYKVKEFAGGRIVVLMNEDWFSPIKYKDKNGDIMSINHYFAYIDGKFRIIR